MKKTLINLIKLYQRVNKIISPDLTIPLFVYPDCRFYPSCSNYAIETILKHGVLKGSVKISARILRCNPLSKGGVDQP